MVKNKFFKKAISGITVLSLLLPNFANLAVSAEEPDKFQYTMFGRNGITMSVSSNLCMNGNLHTNKDVAITAINKNINGKVTTSADIEKRIKHVYADQKIYNTYFTTNCEVYEEEYVYSDMNIHINNPLFCYNNITLDGNVSLNSSLGALMNINVTGEVKNANNSVVYSKYGNITIENDSTANVNGLIYAPLGTVTINSPNVTINGIIIADQVVINGSSVNINGNDNIARFIGETSENYDFSGLEYLPEEWLGDTDADGLFDIYEKVIDSDPFNHDTDGDGLPDGYEVLTLNTDPLEIDTDGNGVLDGNEDFDTDNLVNIDEYTNQTLPFTPDTDMDGFVDGDEVHIYGTTPTNPDTDTDKLLDGEESYDGTIYLEYGIYFDPLNPDTDGDGISDGDEVFGQTKTQEVQTQDEAITEVVVDMETNGNIDRTLTVESMQDIDAMTSNVYALIGEPFNFETESSFESATITFKIDQSKLGDTLFDNLMILWYNEEEQTFEEMPTAHDIVNSTVSTTTTHFSQYMVVDSEKWYENWNNSLSEIRKMWIGSTSYQRNLHTIILMDCSSSMASTDSYSGVLKEGYNGVTSENIEEIRNSIDSESDVDAYCVKWCDRFEICDGIINNKGVSDAISIITFSNEVISNSGWLDNQSYLRNALDESIGNYGGTANWRNAVNYALNMVKTDTTDLYRIIIISDGNAKSGTISSDEFSSNVILNVVNVGSSAFNNNIEAVAQATGGAVYTTVNASSLTYEKGGFVYIPEQYVGEDSDEDGIPDLVELYGLKPNGDPINTNPNLKDSDGDDIPDSAELLYIDGLLTSDVTIADYIKAIRFNSDPSNPDADGDELEDINDSNPLSQCNYSEYLINVAKSKKTEALQRSLEYLGYFDLPEDTQYGTCGGLTSAAIQLFQLNHRMFEAEKSFKFIQSDYPGDTYYIDTNTYYAIIKEALDNGYSNYPSDLSYEFDLSDYDRQYKPKSIPLEEFNASLNPDNPVIISSVLRKNVSEAHSNTDKVNIYVYDYTPVVDAMLLQGAQIFHFHHYKCNCGTPNTLQPYLSYVTYSDSNARCGLRYSDYPWMISQVKNNALFDVKTKNSWKTFMNNLNADVPYYTSSFPFIYRNEIINAEILGNILFGFAGHAGGYSKSELLNGGSLYSYLTTNEWDNGEDSHYTEYGYDLFSERGSSYSYLHITK